MGEARSHELRAYQDLLHFLVDHEGNVTLEQIKNPEFLVREYGERSAHVRAGVRRFLRRVAAATGQDSAEFESLLINSLLRARRPLEKRPVERDGDPRELRAFILAHERRVAQGVARNVRVCLKMLGEESRSPFDHDDLLWLRTKLRGLYNPSRAQNLFRDISRWIRWLMTQPSMGVGTVVLPSGIPSALSSPKRAFSAEEVALILRSAVYTPDPLLFLLAVTLLHSLAARISDVLQLCLTRSR